MSFGKTRVFIFPMLRSREYLVKQSGFRLGARVQIADAIITSMHFPRDRLSKAIAGFAHVQFIRGRN